MRQIFSLCFLAVMPLAAQQIQVIDDGPVHEAYVTPVPGSIVLDAVAAKPPEPIAEKQPSGTDDHASWIPGYWGWSDDRSDYVWVTGVWRRPPPGHDWIPGLWKQFDEGWVWIPGFWSRVAADDVTHIEKRPPDPLDENVQDPTDDDSFWISGYWSWDSNNNRYSWLGGRWEHLDPDWVFVSSHYTWRPDGYVFVPGYWDWPIEQVGQAYDDIFVEPSARVNVTYEPSDPLMPGVIIRRLFVYYPDYGCYYHHHYYYHVGWWSGWCCTPPWWGWWGWWSFSWSNQWGLWWWWGHPGFPQPFWLVANLANQIGPPGPQLFNMLKNKRGPAIISPRGIVPADKLVGKRPFLPANPKERANIVDRAARRLKPPKPVLRPEGTERAPGQVGRPDTLPPGERPPRGGGRVDPPPRVPRKPTAPTRPPIRRPRPEAERPAPQSRPGRAEPRPGQAQPRPRRPDARPGRPRPQRTPPPQVRPQPRQPTPSEIAPRPRGPQTAPQSAPQGGRGRGRGPRVTQTPS